MKHVSAFALLIAVVSVGSVSAASNPLYTGGWLLNVARSTFPTKDHPEKLIWEIKLTGSQIKWTTTVTEGGKTRYVSFDNAGNAEVHPMKGSRDDSAGTAMISDGNVLNIELKSKRFKNSTTRCSLSADEETMTCKNVRTGVDGTTYKQELVFVRMSSRE